MSRTAPQSAKPALNPKQQRFVQEYLIDLNATQAYIRAGYSAKTANVCGPQQLVKPSIAAAIRERQSQQLEKLELTAVATLEAIRRVVVGDVRDLFDDDGNLKPIKSLTVEQAALIAGFEVVKKNAVAGDGHTDTVAKVRLKDASRYVEMAGKHFALLIEQVQHKGSIRIIHELPA